MGRQRVIWVVVCICALALLYGVSFGPVLYLVVKSEKNGIFPDWLETPITATFYPHLWAGYHYEPYFDYFAWFADDPGGTFTWQDFRERHADKFGTR